MYAIGVDRAYLLNCWIEKQTGFHLNEVNPESVCRIGAPA
jgi:hypothetical protein